ncbi:hypothetical protein QP921_02785 [Corynebacterium pseudodiphtheriticum]|uniref:hypothetical protein n=1 Tax=Corynebacterium pseudodiphtheriticum TaxID=37637 RepID=UPI0025507827|nr:hypothetical protein [Corynebacterium pseudodiphtheriticum]MDK8760681.1 hypothetical protein [Corynebacterium pseudodiphtheriticum]
MAQNLGKAVAFSNVILGFGSAPTLPKVIATIAPLLANTNLVVISRYPGHYTDLNGRA